MIGADGVSSRARGAPAPVERREGHGDVARGEHGGDQRAPSPWSTNRCRPRRAKDLRWRRRPPSRQRRARQGRRAPRRAAPMRTRQPGVAAHDKLVWPHAAHRRLDLAFARSAACSPACSPRRPRRLAWRVADTTGSGARPMSRRRPGRRSQRGRGRAHAPARRPAPEVITPRHDEAPCSTLFG